MLKWTTRIALIVAGLFAVFFFGLMLLKHSIKFYGHEAFVNADRHLSVEATTGLAARYGIIQIWRDGNGERVMLKPQQWDSAVALWESARTMQSKDWRTVGVVAEQRGSDSSRLEMSAGHGVRFTITAGPGCATFDVAPPDFDRFARSSRDIQRYADGGSDALPMTSMSWADAFHSTVVTIEALAGIPERHVQDCGKL